MHVYVHVCVCGGGGGGEGELFPILVFSTIDSVDDACAC